MRTLPLIFAIACWSLPADLQAASAAPNIVVIYADDLGYGDIQCYNPQRGKIPTPNVDNLASEGMRFIDAHSSSGVCSPSRYTILTGRYHWRSRLQSGIVGLWGPPLITPDRLTIGGLAKKHGYHTACIGKWHLGWDWSIPAGKEKLFSIPGNFGQNQQNLSATDEHRTAWRELFSKPIAGGPVTVGFDEYFGTDIPNWPPYCFIENDRTVGIPSEYAPPKIFFKKHNGRHTWGPAVKGWTLEQILPALGDRAAAFIQREAKTPEPFLLYMPLTSPHTPLAVNAQWKGKSKLNLYADFVMETDAIVGQVLEALEKSGAAKNTLVIFTSDNGNPRHVGAAHLEKMGHYPSGPLRGYKADAWEGGHRVPFIVRWPGVVKAKSTCDQLVHQADLLATFAGIFETKLPASAGEDSFSLIPLLKGETGPIREHAMSTGLDGTPAVRMGEWKYIPARFGGGYSKIGNPLQLVQLYDLADDLGERRNVAVNNPKQVEMMEALLEKLIVQGRSTSGPKQKNDVKVVRYPR